MGRDVQGLVVSYGFVFLVIGLSKAVERLGKEAEALTPLGLDHLTVPLRSSGASDARFCPGRA